MLEYLNITLLFTLLAASQAFNYNVKSLINKDFISHNSYNTRLLSTTNDEELSNEKFTTEDIPKNLPSAVGIDYIPLATMLATGDFLGADDFTRNNLIKLAGKNAIKRQYVYFTEVKNLPSIDLATMERLWLQFSNGNYGYSVQKRIWDIENGDFDNFIRRIGWTKIENDRERKLKWFGQNEFIYDLTGPKGHLPLTSALRGTQLITKLMEHSVWNEYDWKNYKDIKWD